MGKEWENQYLSYAQGYDLSNRMPLWVKPADKLSAQNVMEHMRNHYEGTALDTTGKLFPDVGAGASSLPTRYSPIVWSTEKSKADGKQYFNERTIAQSPTGWSIVCQSRPDVPRQMAALMWFGIDDSSTSVHFPVYGSITRIPFGWAGPGPQDGATPPLMNFSLDSAFYVFNLVANYAYSRWDLIYADVHQEIVEAMYLDMSEKADATALSMLASGDVDNAVEYLTKFSNDIGESLLREWFAFFGRLFVKFHDGYITTASPEVPVCGCSVSSAGYQNDWYQRIIDENAELYQVPEKEANTRVIRKRDLRAFL